MASGRVLCWSQHLWQPSGPLTSLSSLSLPLVLFVCLHISLRLSSILPSRIARFRGGVKTNTEKAWKRGTFNATRSVSSASTSLHHCHNQLVTRLWGHPNIWLPPSCFLRSVGSICLQTPAPSTSLATRVTVMKPNKILWLVISVDKLLGKWYGTLTLFFFQLNKYCIKEISLMQYCYCWIVFFNA